MRVARLLYSSSLAQHVDAIATLHLHEPRLPVTPASTTPCACLSRLPDHALSRASPPRNPCRLACACASSVAPTPMPPAAMSIPCILFASRHTHRRRTAE